MSTLVLKIMSVTAQDQVMAKELSVLAFSFLIPMFDGTGPVHEFLSTVQQVVSTAPCTDSHVLCLYV